jgi:hypothetical protein
MKQMNRIRSIALVSSVILSILGITIVIFSIYKIKKSVFHDLDKAGCLYIYNSSELLFDPNIKIFGSSSIDVIACGFMFDEANDWSDSWYDPNILKSWISDSNTVKELNGKIDILKQEVSNIKDHIVNDPESMATLPLIKRDIEHLSKLYKNLRSDLNITRDLFKWLIGAIITLCLGLFSIAIAIIVKDK